MNNLLKSQKTIEKVVVSTYKKIERTFVDGYKKIETKFVEEFLTPDDIFYDCKGDD